MRTATLGSSGLGLTRVGFGSWAVGGAAKFGWGPVDDRQSIAAIRYAIGEGGVNWIVTYLTGCPPPGWSWVMKY